MPWLPLAVLANVDVNASIDGGELALVPANDERVREINRRSPRHAHFIRSFTDAFGRGRAPSVLLKHPNASDQFRRVEAIASFRDLIAIAVITRSRALNIRYQKSHLIHFSNTFDIYPWSFSNDYQHLIAMMPALGAIDDPAQFRGQTAPEVMPATLSARDIDEPLLSELLLRWRRRYSSASANRQDVALMRSLNMANRACQVPGNVDATEFDFGRMTGLWVSAFEILVHSGSSGRGGTGPQQVFSSLEGVRWLYQVNRKANIITYRKGSVIKRRPVPSWLYQQLYNARNAYLHGNDLERAHFVLPQVRRRMADFAAPLYRLLLTSELGLDKIPASPPDADLSQRIELACEASERRRFQDVCEAAVAMSRGHDPQTLGRKKRLSRIPSRRRP